MVLALLVVAQYPRDQQRLDGQDEADALQPVAKYLTLQSPITDETIGWVRRTGLELQNTATMENRPAFLILEVTPGTSQFHHVYELSRFLTSSDIPNVKTIAWIPETVVGHNAIVALASNEIVMHPDAELGDIGLGQALDADLQINVRNLVAKRRNTRVNESLAVALMDPQATLVQLTVEPQPGVTETRLVTEEEADRILASGVVIRDRQTIKEPGTPGVFSGDSARNHDVLVVQTAPDRRALAEAYRLPLESLREERAPGETDAAVSMIEVHGVIDPVMETFLLRQIDRAVDQGAKTIIFDVDSPGGGLFESHDLAFAIADLENRDVRTIAWVSNQAVSGGAFIALGCDEIYMRGGDNERSAHIGDILPIEVRPGQPFERAPEKILAPLREWLRDIADMKGRPTAVTMAMADPAIEVFQVTNRNTGAVWYMSEDDMHREGDAWEQGRIIEESREGLPLHVGSVRAHELKIAEPPVAEFGEVLERVGLSPDAVPHTIGQTWVDGLIFTLNHPWVMGLLFFVGIICIYLELHFMTGLLGIVSAVCFGLFFWSKMLGGTAGWLEIVLFVLGMGCIAMEIFVVPGFGVFGVSGGLLIFASLVMASQTFNNLEPGRDISDATQTLGTLSASIIAVIVIAMSISRFLPRIPILNQLILTPPGMNESLNPDEPRLRPELTDSLVGSLQGAHGTAMTVLRPSGKATIDGRVVDVVSDGGFIGEGDAIEVVRVTGNRIVVRQIQV